MLIDAAGRQINATLEGPKGAPVVTLSHSLAAHMDMWRPQMPALTERFRVLRYDVRGHGGTPVLPGDFSLRDLAADLHALLAALGIERTHLVGLSMGGMIGQQLAVDHPELLESLVLADTLSVYGPEAQPMWQGRIDAARGPQGMEPLVEPTITRWFTEPFRRAHPETMDWVRGMIRATVPAGFIGCCRALMALNLTARLPEVRIPALVLIGRQDPTTPVAGAEVIANALPDARLAIIDDAAHISNVEQPDAFTQPPCAMTKSQNGLLRVQLPTARARLGCGCQRARRAVGGPDVGAGGAVCLPLSWVWKSESGNPSAACACRLRRPGRRPRRLRSSARVWAERGTSNRRQRHS